MFNDLAPEKGCAVYSRSACFVSFFTTRDDAEIVLRFAAITSEVVMKKSFAIVLALLLAACNHEETAKAEVGAPAPPIVAIGVHDEVVSLPEHPSRPLVLTFWSATCGMCIQELQEMQRLQAAHPQAVDILAVNIDGADSKTLQAVATRRELKVPVAADQLGVTAERYRVSGTPTNFLIGRDGKIVAAREGLLEREVLQRWFSGQ